jgi:hypothetical protein
MVMPASWNQNRLTAKLSEIAEPIMHRSAARREKQILN